MWGDKNNNTLMGQLQVLQNKAAKVLLNLPPRSSSTTNPFLDPPKKMHPWIEGADPTSKVTLVNFLVEWLEKYRPHVTIFNQWVLRSV